MSNYPYPLPVAIKTKRRCQFSMPGMHYDCRRMGRFVLDGKGFCGLHYDTTWKREHPIYGQQHEWHIHVNQFSGEADRYESCRRCGIVKVKDGLPQNPCRGVMPRIVLRGS